uniref:Uncharacterized protein n=1 Tax=Alexandrium andersonii TaxID=327968 RepID=A0A7S2AC96_9DINO
MELPPAVAAWLRKWWQALRKDHSVLGIVSAEEKEKEGKALAFTATERCLCLGMSVACTWISVYSQHWVRKERKELLSIPKGLEYYFDSGLCALASGFLNLVIGKSLVKMILKKDWDQKDGARGIVSSTASSWAAILSFGALAHAINVFLEKPWEVARPLLLKWADSSVLTVAVVEPAQIGASVLVGMS